MRPDAELPTLPLTPGGADDPAHGATYGRFVSLGVIGRGGMGVVLRARDPELEREVAIKLLGANLWGSDPTSTLRLQREAQAMAKLSHPNVVTVYEMGQVGAERFIAMELVEGTTLRRWLEQPRAWREILAAFVACGRGLAAAHAAGLVHRDFKPENVLIGKDGRPRVSDFGLVAHGVAIEPGDAAADASPITPLTVRGSTLGTPAYMASEQWRGDEVDARTDQFAFAVALWEGLYRERPFAGAITGELRDHILAGDVRQPPREHRVPRWIEPVLRRALSPDRAARWPSMTAILAELDRPVGRRWPWIAGGSVALAGAAVAIVFATRPAADPCPDPVGRLAGVWDPATRDRVAAAFTAASPTIAGETMDRIGPALDRYAGQWRDATRSACRATRVDGTQSAGLLDQRMECLERRRSELATLIAALAAADRDRVVTAVDRVGGLGHLDACADREALLAAAPPTDPAQRAQVDTLEAELAASRALAYANRPPDRVAKAQAALASARKLGRLPQLVHALEEVYDAAEDNNDTALREASLRELAQRSAEAADDRLAAGSWLDLMRLLAKLHRPEEAKVLEPVAEAAVARAGSPPELRFHLAAARSIRRMYAGELAESIEEIRDAIEVATTDPQRATALLQLAQVMYMKDGGAAALEAGEQGLAMIEKAYGPNHPRTAEGLYLVGEFLVELDQLDRAEQMVTRALALRQAAYSEGSHDVAVTLHMLGNIANQRDDAKTARGYYERAVAMFDALHEPTDAGLSRGMLAAIVADANGLEVAGPIFAAALADLAPAGKDQIQYISTEVNYARRLAEAGQCADAAPMLAHVADVVGASPRLLYVLMPQATCDLAAKRTGDAIAKLERGLALCSGGGCPPPLLLELNWRLGKILVETRRDRARGMKLVDDVVAGATEYDTELVAEIKAWRAKQ